MAERNCGTTTTSRYISPTVLYTSGALVASRRKSSETSRSMMSPSLEGTSATSFSSWVRTDIFTTLVNGSTSRTPGSSTRGETMPKKSFTPT